MGYIQGVFAAEIIIFCYHFFEKITKFLKGGDAFSVKNFSSRFPRGKSLLNILLLKFKMLITSYKKTVDNF